MAHLLLLRGAVLVKGTLVGVKDPLLLPVFAGAGTGKDVRRFLRVVGLMPHPAVPGTQGRPVEIEGDIRIPVDLRAWGDRHVLLCHLRGRCLR